MPSSDQATAFQLHHEHASFVTRDGISSAVAARDATNQPSVAKALAVRVLPDQRTLEVFVDAQRAATLLNDLRAGSGLALVCSEPGSHRTIQLKADRASIEPATEDDAALAAAKVDALVALLATFGYRADGLRAYFGFTAGALTKVTFVSVAAFAQTPGPGAGARLAA